MVRSSLFGPWVACWRSSSVKRKGLQINEPLVSHLSPLGWEHINLSGDYIWRNNLKLGSGKYRPLRTVDVSLYKKQA
nr:Tn3 family transposase [Klebsiella pneumoniae]